MLNAVFLCEEIHVFCNKNTLYFLKLLKSSLWKTVTEIQYIQNVDNELPLFISNMFSTLPGWKLHEGLEYQFPCTVIVSQSLK